MDRDVIVLRNQRMAEAFHTLPTKHKIRRAALRVLGHIPIRKGRTRDRQRILVMRPDHLGDVLLTTPAIRALRDAYPDAEIHALVGTWSADVLANYPEIDVVLTLPFPGFNRTLKRSLRSPYDLALQTARRLRRVGYESAIIFRPDHWWGAMVAHWAGIPRRVGYNLPDTAHFLTDPVEHQHQHVVLQSARLVERLTGRPAGDLPLTFPVDPRDRAWVEGYLSEWGLPQNGRIIAIHPGSGTWVKRWTEERWADVADTLADQLGATVVFTGGDHELPLVKSILDHMRHEACVIVGDTRVGSLAALFERASVVMGPDSGPLHLATAVGTPTVALFGPADPVEFGLWGNPERHQVLFSNIGCRPCRVLDWRGDDPAYHPCVRDISVGRVLEAARRAMQSR